MEDDYEQQVLSLKETFEQEISKRTNIKLNKANVQQKYRAEIEQLKVSPSSYQKPWPFYRKDKKKERGLLLLVIFTFLLSLPLRERRIYVRRVLSPWNIHIAEL